MDLGLPERSNMNPNEVRGEVVFRRTYSRPDDKGIFESWDETVDRVIGHQKWLWERALTHQLIKGVPLKDVREDMREWVHLNHEQLDELEELRRLILDRKGILAGRTMWLGGTKLSRKRESSMFNCSFSNIETVFDVVDIFWLLLQGCGVGAKPIVGTLTGFRAPIKEIEVIRSIRTLEDKGGKEANEETFIDGVWTISIGDSAEAWAKSIGKILAGKYEADKLILDFSEIRAAGERLKGYGWISSGDEQIHTAYPAICKIMNRKAGSILSRLDIIEICNLLGSVLSSRRSAEITFVDYGNEEWEEFAKFKENCFVEEFKHRQQSNNSLMFWQKPSKEQLTEVFDIMIRNGGSEPGMINAATMKKRAPFAQGLNPCVHGDTLVHTNKGLRKVSSLMGKAFKTLEGYNSEGFFYTGNKKVYELETAYGYKVKVTNNHKLLLKGNSWKELKDIKIGEEVCIQEVDFKQELDTSLFDRGWLLGEIVGDGGFNPSKYPTYLGFWGDNQKTMYSKALKIVKNNFTNALCTSTKKPDKNGRLSLSTKYLNTFCDKYIYEGSKDFKLALEEESLSFIAGFISGFFDADGSVRGNLNKGLSIRLSQSNIPKLESVQRMLLNFGIISTLYKNRKKEGMRLLPDSNRNLKEYYCKASHELVISKSSIRKFTNIINFKDPEKRNKLEIIETNRKRAPYKDKFFSKVISIIPRGNHDVYDCTVENSHKFSANGIVVHNCAEILLASKSFCCLVEINAAKFLHDTAGMYNALRIISRANYRQTCVDLRDEILQESWHLNNEFLRLCGVSQTGSAMRDDLTEYELKNMRYSAVYHAREMAHELSTPFPKNVTTQKPSGTVSKLMNTTEGIHRPLGKYIFNWINFSKHDPLVEKLQFANYRHMNNPTDTTSILVCFPIKWDNIEFTDKIVTRKDGTKEILEINTESAIDQLERYKKYQVHWCDQNVSNTISYDIEEKNDIVNWLLNNWDIYVGVSFIFRTDPTMSARDLGYDYLPQEVVTREKYEEYVKEIEEVNFDGTDSFEELIEDECAGGMCPIK